jgi:predicted MFS family arabinose efflux permease
MTIPATVSVAVQADLASAEAAEPTNVLGAIWPLILLSLVVNLPNPASNIFVGPVSADYGLLPATVASMRTLGGIAALVIGFLAAPLFDRFPRAVTVTLGLAFVVTASALPLTGQIVGLMVSFAAIGAGLSIVLPAVQAACGDLFTGPDAGRAASLVAAGQTFANVVAGPILALPAMVAGWHGAYLSIMVTAVVAMVLVAPRLSWRTPPRVARTGYRQAFALVAKAPGAVPLLLSSTVRYCVVQAWLAFLAATLTDRFEAGVATVAVFWFVGAGIAVVGNIGTSRVLRSTDEQSRWWRDPELVLIGSTAAMMLTAPLVYLAPTIELALAATFVFCLMIGLTIAATVSVLLARYSDMRGTMMSLNATGQNVGIVLGTGLASLALTLGGYAGQAAALSGLCAVSVGIMLVAHRDLSAGRIAVAVAD